MMTDEHELHQLKSIFQNVHNYGPEFQSWALRRTVDASGSRDVYGPVRISAGRGPQVDERSKALRRLEITNMN